MRFVGSLGPIDVAATVNPVGGFGPVDAAMAATIVSVSGMVSWRFQCLACSRSCFSRNECRVVGTMGTIVLISRLLRSFTFVNV